MFLFISSSPEQFGLFPFAIFVLSRSSSFPYKFGLLVIFICPSPNIFLFSARDLLPSASTRAKWKSKKSPRRGGALDPATAGLGESTKIPSRSSGCEAFAAKTLTYDPVIFKIQFITFIFYSGRILPRGFFIFAGFWRARILRIWNRMVVVLLSHQ